MQTVDNEVSQNGFGELTFEDFSSKEINPNAQGRLITKLFAKHVLGVLEWFFYVVAKNILFGGTSSLREYYSVVHFICGGILASHQLQTLLITRSPHTALPVDLFYDQTLTLSLLGIN